MISATKAFDKIRVATQEFLNLLVVISYAVPALRDRIADVEQNKAGATLPKPDQFQPTNPLAQLKSLTQGYEDRLAYSIVLTGRSCFEAYVEEVIKEMIAFHGGKDSLLDLARTRVKKVVGAYKPEVRDSKRKLQEPAKRTNSAKYEIATKSLKSLGFRFPTELLCAYGVKMLMNNLNNFKAYMIDDLLTVGLGMDLTEGEIKRLVEIRDTRNAIAHGDQPPVTFKQAMKAFMELRDFTTRTDKHLVEHFFVIQKYA